MEEPTSFRQVLSSISVIKVLDFFLEHEDFDYSLTEISDFANVSWSTLHTFWKDLVKWEIVIKTRRIGRADLYKLNKESKIVKKLLELDRAISDYFVDKELRRQGYDPEELIKGEKTTQNPRKKEQVVLTSKI